MLDAGEAHLFYADPAALEATGALSSGLQLLLPDERARHDRFVFERHRREFLATRVLVRTVLSRYSGVPPAAFRFKTNPWGRPEIDVPSLPRPLCFNLSNTEGLAVCLVAWDRELGVDVENTCRRSAPLDVADRYFAPSEVAALRSLPLHQQSARFFDYWTLKESYIKARGMGLAIRLDWFSLDLGAHDTASSPPPIRLTTHPALCDDAGSWRFELLSPTADHRVAVCLRDVPASLRLVVRDFSLWDNQ